MCSQKTYVARKVAGRCVNCGQRNPTKFVTCLRCRKENRKRASARRQGRIATGHCELCGKDHKEQTARCRPCKDQARDVMRGIRETRYDAGLCTQCGKKYRPHGEMICASCCIRNRERKRKGRDGTD